MLAHFVNTHNVYVPIKRLEEKVYLFGTKKIQCQIINGVLMIRVGGGYMSIEEFVDRHADAECKAFKLRMLRECKPSPEVIKDLVKKYRYKYFTGV